MTNALVLRLVLGYEALVGLQVGVWALTAPRSFYDDFPGFGRTWIAVDGPYNEHLVRDVGALNLALVAVLVAAIVWLTREFVTAAAVSALAWTVPHFLYHLFNRDRFESTSDVVINVVGLALLAALPVWLLVASRRMDAATSVDSVHDSAHEPAEVS